MVMMTSLGKDEFTKGKGEEQNSQILDRPLWTGHHIRGTQGPQTNIFQFAFEVLFVIYRFQLRA
jgi:hypothetical protein